MSRRRASRRGGSNRADGFTLIELMVAAVLICLVAAGMFSSITIIGRAQNAAAGIDVAQTGVRAAFDLLSRDLEMTGAGARGGIVYAASGAPAQIASVKITDSAVGPDRIDLVMVDASVQTSLILPLASGGTGLSVNSATGFSVGDAVQVTDLVTPTLYTVTAIAAGLSGPILQVTANGNALPKSYPAGSYVFRSRSVSYYVDSTLFGAADPLLMLDPDGPNGPATGQPIAEGIEDFQAALGVDANGDGIITSLGAAAGDDEWIFNVAGEVAPASLSSLKSVRITIVAKPTSALAGVRGQRPTAEDHPGAAAADAFPRRVLSSEVTLRNFNL